MILRSYRRSIPVLLTGAALIWPTYASAQDVGPFAEESDAGVTDEPQRRTDALVSEILVTARKKAVAESAQEVPVAVTAFGSDQIEAIQLQDVTDISGRVPGVTLTGIGTFKGTGAFSIRGLGQTSSVSSLEPYVGTFIDGVYLGTSAVTIMDTFDLESIEVLRGPQGTLFGRNVVGGAVLMNTKRPTRDFRGSAKASLESGLRGTGLAYTTAAVVSGPISETLSFKVGGYFSKDEGWFTNTFNGKNYGKDRTILGRAALLWQPTSSFELLVRYEHGDTAGDGTVSQSHPKPSNGVIVPPSVINGRTIINNHSRYSQGVTNSNEGFDYQDWDFVVAEANLDVGFGNGVITNIFGFREGDRDSEQELDATANTTAEGFTGHYARQFSNELRYAGTFGAVDVTAGFYAFQQDLDSRTTTVLFGGANSQTAGGKQDGYSLAPFANADFHLGDKLTLSGGLRYTYEHKKVNIASSTTNTRVPLPAGGVPNPNPVSTPYCTVGDVPNRDPVFNGAPECFYDFNDSDSSKSLSFKFGFLQEIADNARIYGNWARAFRAGGYNSRNASFLVRPGPIRDERVDSWELGLKAEPVPRSRLSLAGFYSLVDDLQRVSLVVESPLIPPVAKTINAGDGEVYGIEFEALAEVFTGFVLQGNISIQEARYSKIDPVFGDLNNDRVIDFKDERLDFPKFSPVTYFLSGTYSRPLGGLGEISANLSYFHQDRQWADDANVGFINSINNIDASLALSGAGGAWEVSVYGKNLTDQTRNLADADVGALGSVNAIIARGRIFGVAGKIAF